MTNLLRRARPRADRRGAETAVLHLVRALNRLVPKRPQSALIGAPDIEDGLIALADELLDRGRDVVLLTAGEVPPGFFDRRVRLVSRRSPAGWWAYARSREVFTTHGVYGDLEGPRSQRRAYVWHGEPTGKVIERYVGGPAKPTSIAPTIGSVTQAFRSAEFGLPPWRVPITGAPRNDRLMRADRSGDHPLLTDHAQTRTALLWLPTYRSAEAGLRSRTDSARGYAGLPYDADELRAIDERLHTLDVAVFVKLHPFAVGSFDLDTKALVPITDATLHRYGLTTYTAVPRFAGLITDVSSIWIDYLLVDRPIVFAFPDLEEYRRNRGFTLEPFEDWVPGPVTTSVDALLAEIGSVARGEDRHGDARARMGRLLHRHHDDAAARRLVDVMLSTESDDPADRRFASAGG